MTSAEYDKVVADLRAARRHESFMGLPECPAYNMNRPAANERPHQSPRITDEVFPS